MKKKEQLQKSETHYNLFVGNFGEDEYGEEDVEIIQGNGNGTDIKVILFQERWRSPETTVIFLRALADNINHYFVKGK